MTTKIVSDLLAWVVARSNAEGRDRVEAHARSAGGIKRRNYALKTVEAWARSFGACARHLLASAVRKTPAAAWSLSAALLAGTAHAHHSYAMYDGAVYKVITGVIVRIVPNAAHFEMHIVPLNEERDALVRDEAGEPLVWVVQMERAREAAEQGINRESFPQGTVLSVGLHPRRDGLPAGDRGDAGLYRCPDDGVPGPGLHCDSVQGGTPFGPGEIPQG